MNNDFITNGIENDRYLKAVRLYKQFEGEMIRELQTVAEATIDKRPELFPDDVSVDTNISRRRTEPLGHMRADYEMDRVNDDGDNLVFHVCIEWSQPEVHGHDEPDDGALCIIFYKIKNLDRPEYERVKQLTQGAEEWSAIQFDDDVWNSDLGLFYIPISGSAEFKQGFETLQSHFLTFADEYGT